MIRQTIHYGDCYEDTLVLTDNTYLHTFMHISFSPVTTDKKHWEATLTPDEAYMLYTWLVRVIGDERVTLSDDMLDGLMELYDRMTDMVRKRAWVDMYLTYVCEED